MRNHDETSRGVRPFVLGLSWWLALGSVVAAQCPAPSWSGMNAVPGVYDVTSPTISTHITWDPDGAAGPLAPVVVAAGGFSVAGNTTANHVAAWDGSAWYPLGNVSASTIGAFAVLQGELYASATSSSPTPFLALTTQ